VTEPRMPFNFRFIYGCVRIGNKCDNLVVVEQNVKLFRGHTPGGQTRMYK